MKNNAKNIIQLLVGLLIYVSYFFSFIFNENSIGSGGYYGDLNWIWQNFEIFKSNNLLDAINDENFFGNRTPLFYIINIFLNPFIDDIDSYRLSVFIFFIISPIILYFTLKNYFPNDNQFTLFCISSFLLLSPYFRSSSVWAQEINYGILSLIITFFYYIKYKHSKSFFNLFFIILFSSLCVYFDQKLLIVPLFCFYNIIIDNKLNLKFKLISILLYFIYALPFVYLITVWGGIVPSLTQEKNFHSFNSYENFNFHFYHIGYAATMIALYLIPLIILKNKVSLEIINNFLKKNYLIIILPISIYIFLYIFFDWYDLVQSKQYLDQSGKSYGLGFVNKLGIIFFSDLSLRKAFTYFAFFGSWLITIYAISIKATSWFIIIYFFFISLILLPIMQEYFDPYIFLLSFLMAGNSHYNFSFNRTLITSLFFITALSFAIIYY